MPAWIYWWRFGNPDLEKIPLQEHVFIWKTESGQIAAVLNPEQMGQVFLQIHPDFRTFDLEEEMIFTAKQHMSTTGKDRHKKLCLWVDSKDKLRHEILTRRGFRRDDSPEGAEIQHRRSLDEPIPDVPLTPGIQSAPRVTDLSYWSVATLRGLASIR